MPGDLSPEHVLNQLKKGELSPVYLFYGPGEFRLEQVLNRIRESFIPEGARDFNLKLFYGDRKTGTVDIIDEARSLPFMSQNRLIIVRRTEEFQAGALEGFIPYLDDPLETTCLIFVSSKPDFRKKFYKKIKAMGCSVNFKQLYDN
ncbi:DNA polymerase III subunit delta, partial [bacterium]|nr:DNA polymerase III subunit delta [bacterium]